MGQGGLFERGEMAVSVRVFVRGRLEGFALRHAARAERRAALRASAADSQDGETTAFFAELVLEGTQKGRQGARDSQRRSNTRLAMTRNASIQPGLRSPVLDAEIAAADCAAPCVAEAVMMPPSNLERCKPGHANCAVDYEKKKAEDQAENPEVFSVDVSAAVIDG